MKQLLTASLLFTALLASAQTTRPGWHSPLDTMDSDRDGVPDSKDACPHTPPGRPVLANGCAAFELAQRPEILVGPLTDAISKLTTRLPQDTSASGLIFTLNSASQQFDVAASQVRATQVCEAGGTFSAGLRDLSQAQVTLQGMVNVARATLSVPRPRGAYGDASEADLQEIDLEQRQTELTPLISRATDAASVLSTMCRGISGPSARGTITRIDNANRRIELDGGSTIVALTSATIQNGHMFPGGLVATTGATFNDHSVVASSVSSLNPLNVQVFPMVDCMKLRVIPVQYIPNGQPFQNLMVHDLGGYLSGLSPSLLVESGMRFTSDAQTCPETNKLPATQSHALDIALSFTDTGGNPITMSLADYLQPQDMTAQIPFNLIDSKYPASMTVTYLGAMISYDANLQPQIGSYTVIKTETYDAAVVPLHRACDVNYYSPTELFLPDDDPSAYANVHVVEVKSNLTFGGPLEFRALGLSGNFPHNLVEIKLGDPFQIFSQFGPDFYDPSMILPEETVGVNTPSGLMWPHAIGKKNNGKEFSYSCSLPEVVRDLIDDQGRLTYHVLPFVGGYPNWQLTVGNKVGAHTGTEAYAYDFAAPEGTPVVAARGGIVTFVRSDQVLNSYLVNPCNNCLANALRIEHQDHTFTTYLHFPQNGVLPKVGDQVPRGAQVGIVGNTGFAVQPHLHIQVNSEYFNLGKSTEFSFLLKLAPDALKPISMIPLTGQPVWSLK